MHISAELRRDAPAAIRNLSASGALLESRELLRVGAVGVLDVVLDGVRYVEWFRVARVEPSDERAVPHTLAIEVLPIALDGHESLRGALRHRNAAVWPRTTAAGPGMLSGNNGRSPLRLIASTRDADATRGDSAQKFCDRTTREPRDVTGNTIADNGATRTARERSHNN